MAMRYAASRASANRLAESARGATRFFSDGKGKILSEEERAAENIYIQVLDFFFVFCSTFDSHSRFLELRDNRRANAVLRFLTAVFWVLVLLVASFDVAIV